MTRSVPSSRCDMGAVDATSLFIGVDVASTRRSQRRAERLVSTLHANDLAYHFQSGGWDVTTAAAASCAVREAYIKAVGGRWPGFDWSDIAVSSPTGSRDVVARAVDAELQKFGGFSLTVTAETESCGQATTVLTAADDFVYAVAYLDGNQQPMKPEPA